MKKEKWKKIFIDNEEWNYEISNMGNIRNYTTKKLLTPFLSNSGYYRVALSKNGIKKKYSVHRLVAIHFVPIKKKYIKQNLTYDDLVPNHIDANKTHNVKSNLEWVTIKENHNHIVKKKGLELNFIGEKCHLAKMDNNTALKCCQLLSQGKSTKEISELLNVSKKSVQHIKNRETWCLLSKDFVFPKLNESIPYSISVETIHNICKLLEQGIYTDTYIAKTTNTKREYVRNIRIKKLRTDISKDYNF